MAMAAAGGQNAIETQCNPRKRGLIQQAAIMITQRERRRAVGERRDGGKEEEEEAVVMEKEERDGRMNSGAWIGDALAGTANRGQREVPRAVSRARAEGRAGKQARVPGGGPR